MLKDANNVPKRYVFLSLILLCLLIWGAKSNNLVMQFFDGSFSNAIQGEVFNFLEPIMKIITMIAETKLGLIYAILIATYLWFGAKQRVDAVWVICTMFGGAVVAFLVKEFVKRPRPINQIIPETGFSMPSGHTFETFLILAFIYLYFIRPLRSAGTRKILSSILIIWQVLVVWSRIYLGAHYLTDTIVAVALGTVWLWIALMLYGWLYDFIAGFVEPRQGRHQGRI